LEDLQKEIQKLQKEKDADKKSFQKLEKAKTDLEQELNQIKAEQQNLE
jgi:prefoldin subunit 5